jgi:3-oxoacyl-[acyl-carrier-protein] synthase II
VILVTGAGVVTALGEDLDSFWAGLVTGVSGISEIERFPVADLRVTRGGEVKKPGRVPPSPRGGGAPPAARQRWSRASRFLVQAAREALETAGLAALPPPARVAVVIGTALGGIDDAARALRGEGRLRTLVGSLYDGPTRELAGWVGAGGPVLTVSTACASGATSLGLGADLLRAGRADLVLAGGVDVLCRFVQRGFNALRSLTRDEVRPFDRRRSGLLLGEGAGVVVLEREAAWADRGGPPPLGRLLGHASTADGAHITAPDPEGRGLEQAVRLALAEAGLGPAAVELVSAHGTGTVANDRVETEVLKRVLGPRAAAVPVNSIKAHLGHTMGAAATLEAIMCLLAARHGLVPPTLNLAERDPACDLDYVGRAGEGPRRLRPRVSVSTSLGFGGCNAALVLGAP